MNWPPSRTFRSHPDWNGRSVHHDPRRSMGHGGFQLAHNHEPMSSREREGFNRQSYGRTDEARSRQHASTGNMQDSRHASRHRDRHTAVNDLEDSFSAFGIRSRRAGRGVYYEDELPTAPEPPRQWRRNSEYYHGRYDAYEQHNRSRDPARRSSGWQQDHSDAHRYIHGQPQHRRATLERHDPRDYAGLNLRFSTSNSRHHDPSDSFRDRVRRWF